jgi:hypothetical protein
MYKQAIAAKAGDEVVRLIEKFQFIIEEHQTWGSVMYAMARRSARDAHATSSTHRDRGRSKPSSRNSRA